MAASLAFGAIVFARQPRSLTHAVFWGEDGTHWYPDAYQHGWISLTWPVNGYL